MCRIVQGTHQWVEDTLNKDTKHGHKQVMDMHNLEVIKGRNLVMDTLNLELTQVHPHSILNLHIQDILLNLGDIPLIGISQMHLPANRQAKVMIITINNHRHSNNRPQLAQLLNLIAPVITTVSHQHLVIIIRDKVIHRMDMVGILNQVTVSHLHMINSRAILLLIMAM